jgi:hypothetical protein
MADPASISLILYKTVESVSFDNMEQDRNRILWPYTWRYYSAGASRMGDREVDHVFFLYCLGDRRCSSPGARTTLDPMVT